MRTTRRRVLMLAGSCTLSRAIAYAIGRPAFDVDRLIEASSDAHCRVELRKYSASASVMLFSIPLVSKQSVGSGYAVVEQTGAILAIQFGAGSYPEGARGLNRLGFIQEVVVEDRPGTPVECAWLAFMTTSQENNLDQAKKSLVASGSMVPYTASQGYGRYGQFKSMVDRLEFASKFTWRDIPQLVEKARGIMTSLSAGEEPVGSGGDSTFLYVVRRAILDTRSSSSATLVFNRKEFRMDAEKETDATATAHFSEKKLLSAGGSVMRMSAMLTETRAGIRTPFRLWYEAGSEHSLPLRFEYQARSFLRLTFEADAAAATPPIRFAFKASRENG